MKLSAALTIIALLASTTAMAQHEPGNPSGSYKSTRRPPRQRPRRNRARPPTWPPSSIS